MIGRLKTVKKVESYTFGQPSRVKIKIITNISKIIVELLTSNDMLISLFVHLFYILLRTYVVQDISLNWLTGKFIMSW